MDMKNEVRDEQIANIEKLVIEKISGASCRRTPNLLLFTLPLSATNRFPGTRFTTRITFLLHLLHVFEYVSRNAEINCIDKIY